jgi:hypothetical protein
MKTPKLNTYIARVGAEELNFRRYMVKVHRGNYYTERALIKIASDGTISCSNKEFAPTKEEVESIKGELAKADFPKSINAKNIKALLPKVGRGALYEFWDRREGGLIMVQERLVDRKAYVPWSFWSDGEWRRMEPDRSLPFWKPRDKRSLVSRVMVHEGAKSAAFVDGLVNDPKRKKELKDHPFGDFLTLYEHWGMIGGALAPHRADYPELRSSGGTEFIYVCDNDWAGKAVLQEFSKNFGMAVKGIMFDPRFGLSWDLADDVPRSLFTKSGRYIGPKIEKLIVLATRATELIPNPAGTGRPIQKLTQAFREEWYHSVRPEVYIHKDFPSNLLNEKQFNSTVAPYSDADDTARLVRKDAASKSAIIKYSPAMEKGIYSSKDGGRFINTHCPSNVKSEKGEARPFLDFMEHLIPDEKDRTELMRWCATLIALPETKITYGVLLISEVQGVGKSTLGEKILTPILGEWNVSFPSESEIVDSDFNYWLAHKRLAVVHEIYAGHSAKAYNKLKSIITDKFVTVKKKYLDNYEMENWMHVFACSNSMRAIQLSVDDRRWFVPKVTDEKKNPAYWTKFNLWLEEEGGLGIIKAWAEEFVKKVGPVIRGDDAPWSVLKRQVIEEGYSPGQVLVSNFLNRLREEMAGDPKFAERVCKAPWQNGKWNPANGGVLLLDTDLIRLIKNHLYDGRHNDRLEKPLTVRKIAKSQEWFVGDHKVSIEKWGTRGSPARLICSSAELSRRLPMELSKDMRPIDVEKLAQEWKL